jgi:O-antigen ligase
MTRQESATTDIPTALWSIWALAIIPAMFMVPLYVYPFTAGPSHTYTWRRILEIGWAAAFLLPLLWPPIREAVARIWLGLPLLTRSAAGVFVAGAFLSAVVSSAPVYALREWALFVLLFVVSLTLGAILSSRERVVVACLALTLLVYAIALLPAPFEHGFHHPRFMGQALVVATPVLLFSGNLALALVAGPALALGVVNGSRALVLTMVVITIAAMWLWDDRRARMIPAAAGLAVTTVMVLILVAVGHDDSVQAAIERGTTLTGRGTIWRESFELFLQAPVLGIGPGMLARVPLLGGWSTHPHNSLFLIAAETGLVGLVSIGVLVFQGLRRLPRMAADRRPWALALLAGGFHSMFSGTIIVPTSQVLLVLALGMVLRVPPDNESRSERGAPWLLPAVGAMSVAVLFVTLGVTLGDFGFVVEGDRPFGVRFFSPGAIP